MLAVARTMRNGVMNAFEFLCIVERNGGLVYQAMPNGRQPATDFTLTKMDGNSLTFENPAHDFPKMIRYTLEIRWHAGGGRQRHGQAETAGVPLQEAVSICTSDQTVV